MDFKDKKIAVLGFGLEGRDAVNFLLKRKANITVFERKEKKDINTSTLDISRFKLICGENYLEKGLRNYDIIVRSAGVYRFLPQIIDAEEFGVEITSPIKIFFDLCPGKIIGVTGTKGKGTTSTLIYKILKKDGRDVYLAGNIGIAYLSLLSKLKNDSWTVLELSSFQLVDIKKSPYISVVLNITADHLDWHKDQKSYTNAKKQIISFQNKSDFAVINNDYPSSYKLSKLTNAKVYYFSIKNTVKGSYVKNGKVYLDLDKKPTLIGQSGKILLKGKHNWENVCASVCACGLAGASIDSIRNVIFSFSGLEHRLEFVAEMGGIRFYNDSFSTNPQTTIAAINSFGQLAITLILGGSDKALEYTKLAREITKKANVSGVILIGQVAQKIKSSLIKEGYKGKLIDLGKTNMKEIVKTATEITLKGVILLSPAAASFDMFEDYKDRGNQFKKEANILKK